MVENRMSLTTFVEGVIGAVAIGLTILLSPLLRPWYRRWGTTGDEARLLLPGDELVPHPKSEITLASTVNAPVEYVWPWFVQLGCQRAGWYSYDLLDNGGVRSARRILPEYQQLRIGDTVKAMPKGDFGFPVAVLEPGQALSLAGTLNTRTGESAQPGDPNLDAYFSGDQTFYLQPVIGPANRAASSVANSAGTRLIFRMRMDWNPSPLNTLAYSLFVEPISFVMARKTLLNVKKRAEQLAMTKVEEKTVWSKS